MGAMVFNHSFMQYVAVIGIESGETVLAQTCMILA